jgi:hypothetical protein
MNNSTKPKARNTEILVQELEKELLIYDLQINKAFSLNETCAMVWAECDGEKSIAEIASTLSQRTKGLVNDEVVWLALETLQKENLLANSAEISSKFNGLSRREVIRKVGFASMIALPVIASVVAPTALMAQSDLLPLLAVCTTNANCDSGNCRNHSSSPVGMFCCVPTATFASINTTFCAPVCATTATSCCSGTAVDIGVNIPICGATRRQCMCISS